MKCVLAAAVLSLVPASMAEGFLASMGNDVESFFRPAPLLAIGTGGVLSATAFLLEDQAGYPGFMGHGFLEGCAEFCDAALGLPLLGGAGLLWAGGALADDADVEETGMMLTEGLLLTYGASGLLKLVVGRPRPDGSNDWSFPSNHSASTACAAVIVWDRWGSGAGLSAVAIAGFTALSRVTLGKHYPSDVIAGAAIGLSIGMAVVHAHDGGGSGIEAPALRIWWDTENGLGAGI